MYLSLVGNLTFGQIGEIIETAGPEPDSDYDQKRNGQKPAYRGDPKAKNQSQ